MRKITIELNNETHRAWFERMLEGEIVEAEGTISNEELFAEGTDGENHLQHLMNIKELHEYRRNLESALAQLTA